MLRSIGSILTLFVLSVPALAKSGPPANLRVEYMTNPVGLDVDRPRLSWNLNDDRRGAKQTAYELRAATSELALKAARSEKAWDSGKVESDQSVNIVYAGPYLRPRTRYLWQVKVWDQNGKATGWSAPAYWETGLMSRSAWQNRAIRRRPASMPRQLQAKSSSELRRSLAWRLSLSAISANLTPRCSPPINRQGPTRVRPNP